MANRRWKTSSLHQVNSDPSRLSDEGAAPASTGAKSISGAESVFGESTVAANLDFLNDMLAQSSSSIVEGGGQQQDERQESFESFNENDIGSIMDFVKNNASHSNISQQGESSSWKKEAVKPSWESTSKTSEAEKDDERLFTSSLPSLPSRASSRNNGSKGGGSATNNSASSLRKQEALQKEANPAVFESPQEEDDVPPIPFFGGSIINDNGDMGDDDDTISQITSSIASHSYYDASSLLHGGSSHKSGGFFRKQKSSKALASITGESSFADTLDEIADLMNPTNSGRPGMLITTAKSGKPQSYFPPDDLYRHSDSQNDGKGGSTIFQSAQSAFSALGPIVAKIRLRLRYLQSRVLPSSWKSRKTDGEDEDYYNMLMKYDTTGPPGQVKGSRVGTNRMQRRRTVWTAVTLLSIFCGMTLLLLVLRVTMMHATTRVSSSNSTKIVSSSATTPAGKTVRGGMSVRGGMAGGMSSVRGGMARHSVEEVVTTEDNAVPETAAAKKSDYSHLEHVGMEIPPVFNNLHDVNDFPVQLGVDVPFYWHIPRTGGGTVNDIFGGCLSKTIASDAGGTVPEGKSDKLQVVKFSEQFSYVNVDTSNPTGIERAKSLGLVSSGLAHLVVSPWLHEASELFTPKNKGRLFTIFRHPVERAVSLFHYVQDTQWRRQETFKKELAELTIEEYFKSGVSENNWMTRFLIKELTKGELTQQDVNLAKEVLRRKALVLLLSEKGESFSRLERYFGWQLKSDEEKECHEKKLQWAWPLKHRHDEVEEGTPLWDLIMSHNVYDMELYEYAHLLFQEQGKMFH